jgi:small GTP-binding protein
MGAAISAKVLVLGLDGAGKTSLSNYLEEGPSNDDPEPSTAFNTAEKKHKGIAFTMYDVAGGKKSRELWKHYYEDTDGMVWMVDAADAERFKESSDALAKAMKDAKLPSDVPVLVLCNKNDKKKAKSVEEIQDELNLEKALDGHEWSVVASNAKQGEGIVEGLDWLATEVKAVLKARKKK